MLSDIIKCRDEIGCRVFATTSYHYFRSLYPSGSLLSTLIERLMEHMGVLYRIYLQDQKNEMWIRWRDVSEGSKEWNDDKVKPIDIPYLSAKEEKIELEYGGRKIYAFYKWGELDYSSIDNPSMGRPFPLKIYYQKNQKTQGIDINIRGRVILPHSLEYLWADKHRHNDLNLFTGELTLDDTSFTTVNNKTQLDPNNPVWDILLEKLQEERFKPQKKGTISYTEKEIRKKLLKKLPSIVLNSTAQEEFDTWPGLGVKIDLMHRHKSGEEDIYELKAGVAKPIDVYQLVMYWDGRVQEGVRPRLGRLVAKEANQHVDNLIEYWNKRKDNGGQNYNLEFKKIDDLI